MNPGLDKWKLRPTERLHIACEDLDLSFTAQEVWDVTQASGRLRKSRRYPGMDALRLACERVAICEETCPSQKVDTPLWQDCVKCEAAEDCLDLVNDYSDELLVRYGACWQRYFEEQAKEESK